MRAPAAFTLLEMIIAMTVVVMAMLVVVQAMARVQDTWKMTDSKVREAQDARAGLEAMSGTLTRATLNGRWTPDDDANPDHLLRDSDLHFVCGPADQLFQQSRTLTGHAIFFQAPMGYAGPDDRASTTAAKAEYDTLPGTLNAWGYFVEFGADPAPLPAFVSTERRAEGLAPKRYRFRLMEFRQPAHELRLFQTDGGDPPQPLITQTASQQDLYRWFDETISNQGVLMKRRCAVVAENILAAIIEPVNAADVAGDAGGTTFITEPDDQYLYDSRRFQWDVASPHAAPSRHRLPLAVKLSVIVLDERDWDKLTDDQANQAGLALRGLVTSRFQRPTSFTSDMGTITGELNRRRMKHRVVTVTIPIPGGRWTTDDETN